MGWSASAVFDGRRWYDWTTTDPDDHPVSPRSKPPYLSFNVYDSTVVALYWQPGCTREAFLCGTWREEFGEDEDPVSEQEADRSAIELAQWLRLHANLSHVPDGLEATVRRFLAHDGRADDDYTFAEDDLPAFLLATGIPLPTPDEVADFL